MDRGNAAVDPGGEVVGVADDGWGCADDAAFVAGVEGAAQCSGDESLAASDVEWFGG
jgi:hypothetical protein